MPTTVRLNPKIEERYTLLANGTGRSKSFYITRALEDSIDRLEYEYGILQDVEDYRAGRLDTYTLDEVRARHGLDD